jgi:hypothetical protein
LKRIGEQMPAFVIARNNEIDEAMIEALEPDKTGTH